MMLQLAPPPPAYEAPAPERSVATQDDLLVAAALTDALAALGYPYVDETDNPASRLFLEAV